MDIIPISSSMSKTSFSSESPSFLQNFVQQHAALITYSKFYLITYTNIDLIHDNVHLNGCNATRKMIIIKMFLLFFFNSLFLILLFFLLIKFFSHSHTKTNVLFQTYYGAGMVSHQKRKMQIQNYKAHRSVGDTCNKTVLIL